MMNTLAEIVSIVFRGLELALFIRIIISWIPHDPFHPFIQLLQRVTDPILLPCRNLLDRVIPSGSMGIDFSPLLAFFALDITKSILVKLLISMGGGV